MFTRDTSVDVQGIGAIKFVLFVSDVVWDLCDSDMALLGQIPVNGRHDKDNLAVRLHD